MRAPQWEGTTTIPRRESDTRVLIPLKSDMRPRVWEGEAATTIPRPESDTRVLMLLKSDIHQGIMMSPMGSGSMRRPICVLQDMYVIVPGSGLHVCLLLCLRSIVALGTCMLQDETAQAQGQDRPIPGSIPGWLWKQGKTWSNGNNVGGNRGKQGNSHVLCCVLLLLPKCKMKTEARPCFPRSGS